MASFGNDAVQTSSSEASLELPKEVWKSIEARDARNEKRHNNKHLAPEEGASRSQRLLMEREISILGARYLTNIGELVVEGDCGQWHP